jgi:hypothetical protein
MEAAGHGHLHNPTCWSFICSGMRSRDGGCARVITFELVCGAIANHLAASDSVTSWR